LRLLEEIDMKDENLDIVLGGRLAKLVSIPKTYILGSAQMPTEQLPTKLKLWHRSVAAAGSVVRFQRSPRCPHNALGLMVSI
jgi:hypothetical protein